MSDPWADVRNRWTRDEKDGEDLYRVLDDADALLAMKEPLREIAFASLDVHPADDELAFYKRELQRCITIAAKALAALPEHMRDLEPISVVANSDPE